MTITKADLIAAREAVDMIPKEALDIFGGDTAKQKRAKEAHAIFEERQNSPEYWRNLAQQELAGLDGQDLIDGQKAFVQKHSKELVNQVDAYNKLNQGAASGGMLDRYSGSAGALGLGIGALLGGVFGGKSGALIGGLIGGIGLYAMQKLGIGGDSLQSFFKNAVDRVLGPQAGRVDKDKMLKDINTAAEEATGAKAVADESVDPVAPVVPSAPANTFGADHPDDTPKELPVEELPMPTVDYIGEQPRGLRPSDTAGLTLDAPTANVGQTSVAPSLDAPPAPEVVPPKPSPEEAIQNYKDVHTPTQLPPVIKPVPTGNQADDMEAQLEYENQLNVRKELAKSQQGYADRTKDPVETKRVEDAAAGRVHKAREQMKRSKSAIGQLRDPLLQAKEFGKATVKGVGEGLEQSGEGIAEGVGLVKDVAKARIGEAKAYGKQTKDWLKDKAKDLKYLTSGE
jgi:hypothetical protein